MLNLNKILANGPKNTLRFINTPGLSHKGQWIPIYDNTEIDKFYVGDFSSANYTITVEYSSNKKETMQAMVCARPDQATVTVYAKTGIDDAIIRLSAEVNDSWFSLKASPTDSTFAGAKLVFFANYVESINPLSLPEPVSYIDSSSGGDGGGSYIPGGSGGTASDSFKTIAVSGQSSVVADSATDILTLVGSGGITITTNPTSDTITFTGTGSDTLATVTARGSETDVAITINNSITADSFVTNGTGTPSILSDTSIDLDAGTSVKIVGGTLRLNSFTSTARDALVPTNGDIIYNSTTNKFQGYANGSWVDLH